jgi:hypothetical protein
MGFLDDYEPVEDRIRAFWEEHPEGRIVTQLIARGDDDYIFRAEIYRLPPVQTITVQGPTAFPDATGYAHDSAAQLPSNIKASALEVCETSAIGRALANLGYAAKGKRPSREEMSKSSAGAVQRPASADPAVESAYRKPSTATSTTAATSDGEGMDGGAAPHGGTALSSSETSGGGSEAHGEGVTGSPSVEALWLEARELLGTTGAVVKFAAKVLGRTVSTSKLTAEDLVAVIAAKREAA